MHFNYVEEIVWLLTNSLILSLTHTHTCIQTHNIRLKTIEELAPENVVVLFVGSKADLREERAVSNEVAQAFADSSKMKYIEASAKDDTKIDESFNYLVDAIIENIPKEHDTFVPKEPVVKLTGEPNQPELKQETTEEPQPQKPTSGSGSSSRCSC